MRGSYTYCGRFLALALCMCMTADVQSVDSPRAATAMLQSSTAMTQASEQNANAEAEAVMTRKVNNPSFEEVEKRESEERAAAARAAAAHISSDNFHAQIEAIAAQVGSSQDLAARVGQHAGAAGGAVGAADLARE